MRNLFSFLLVAVSLSAGAQKVFIARDFQNCGMGIKDSNNNWIVQPIYNDIQELDRNYFRVSLGEKQGAVDQWGHTIIPVSYDYVYTDVTCSQTYFMVLQNNKEGLRDSTNREILPAEYQHIGIFRDGSITAKRKWHNVELYDSHFHRVKLHRSCATYPSYLDTNVYLYKKRFPGLRLGYNYDVGHWKSGLIDAQGNFLLRPVYTRISYFKPDSSETLIRAEKKHRIRYLTKDGKIRWTFEEEDVRERGSFERNRLSYLLAWGFTAARINGKWGVAAANGDTILPFIYRSAETHIYFDDTTGREIMLFKIEDQLHRFGIYNATARKWLVEPQYEKLDPDYLYFSRPKNEPVLLLFAKKNGRWGAVTSSGQEILPFVFTSYSAVSYRSNDQFIFMNDTSAVLLSEVQAMKASPYDPKEFRNVRAVSTTGTDKKFDRVEKNGAVLFIDQALVNDPAQRQLYNTHDEAPNPFTYDSLLHATAFLVRPFHHVMKFTDGRELYYNLPGHLYKESPESQMNEGSVQRVSNDTNFFVYDRFDPFPWTGYTKISDSRHSYYLDLNTSWAKSAIYRDDGKQLCANGRWLDELNGIYRFKIQNKKWKEGIIDGDGKLLADTVWDDIYSVRENIAVVSIRVSKKTSTVHSKWSEKNLLDMSTGELLLPVMHTSISPVVLGADVARVEDASGVRLFNTKEKKFVTGGYNSIRMLDSAGLYFAVKTCRGRIGLVDNYGNKISDTIWSAVNFSGLQGENLPFLNRESVRHRYVIFYNDTASIIFNTETGRIENDTQTKIKLADEAAVNYFLDSNNYYETHCRDCPSYNGPHFQPVELPGWQKQVMFDSVFTFVRYEPDSTNHFPADRCFYCRVNDYTTPFFYDWTRGFDGYNRENFVVLYSSPNTLSAEKIYGENRYVSAYFSTMLFSDGPHPMLLDSLFTGTEWRAFITKSILAFLDTTKNVKGDCSNPYLFPLMCNSRFAFSDSALILYPSGYWLDYDPLAIPIPWEKLDPYLRPEVKSRLVQPAK